MSTSLMPNAQQLAVADRVLDEESTAREHVVVSLSGAHAYGFPSPDSDLDLKAIHVERTARLVGLSSPPLHKDRMQIIDRVEIDYTSNELGPVLAGILGGNGNYIERVLGPIALRRSPLVDELAPLVAQSLSTRIHRHYNGFARGQLADFDEAAEPTAKKILYVLRTALTGIHALATGRIVTDVNQLLDEYGFAAAAELIVAKRAGERVVLDVALRERWRREVERALALLDETLARSPLPPEPRNRVALEAWLLEVRRTRF
jgi:predicted nucleotidyltransferase